MPDSRAWYQNVPSDWRVIPLKHALRSIGSGGTPTSSDEAYWSINGDGINFVAIADMSTVDEVEATEKRITEAGRVSKNLTVYPPGTLLYSMYASVGKISRLAVPATINQAILAIRTDERVCSDKYLRWALEYLTARILEEANSNTQDNLNLQKVRNASIALPPIEKQRELAGFLDEVDRKSLETVAKYEQMITLLEEKREALVTQAVTKGLDPDVPMKCSEVQWVDVYPRHWAALPLRRLISKFVDYRGATPQKTEGGVRIVTAANVKRGYIDYDCSAEFMPEEDYEAWMVRGLPEVGDVLLTMEAPLGQCAQVDEPYIGLGQRVMLLKANKKRIRREFLMWALLSQAGQAELLSRATGSTALGIKASKLREIVLIVPTLDEQNKIVAHIAAESKKIDKLRQQLERAIELVKEHRSALITAAVTGQIDEKSYKAKEMA